MISDESPSKFKNKHHISGVNYEQRKLQVLVLLEKRENVN
jgi:hypothetical protein